MQDVAMDEETLPGAFLEASNWQGPSLAGPTALSRDLWMFQQGSDDGPRTAAARAEARSERFAEKHPVGFARPIDPWCLME